MDFLKSVVDYLNANPAQIVLLASVLAVALQYAVNKVKDLGKLTNYVLALVALPGFTTAVAAYTTGLHLDAYPAVVLVGQLVYAVLEAYKRRVVSKAIVQPETPQSGLQVTPLATSKPTVDEY